jgi:class 3 adenylate cyclase/tetratricopeptide (TPR) repeat protein
MTVEHRSERRLVTCLFLDVVGSTDMTVSLGPERMKRDLDRAFADLKEILQGYGGTIEKYIGDAIFVIFGAPAAHTDDPERALRAAIACAEWAAQNRSAGGAVDVRIGVETGEALVDLDAVNVRQQMAVGSVVNLAARLQSQADAGEILVGPTCREATADVAEFARERAAELKGFGAVSVAKLVSLGTHLRHDRLRFVGRDAELARLRATFDRVRAGRATLVLVSGPPGQGKSRLIEEFRATLSPDVRILTARCRPGTESGAFTPLRQLITADVGHGTLDGLATRIAQLLPDVATHQGVLEIIAHSAGLTTSERILALPAVQRRDASQDAWRSYVGAIAREQPVVVWVEDLHWAEPQLVGILDRLAARSESRVLVIATARPEFLGNASLRPGEDLVHLELGPLAPEHALELARAASALAERTIERAEGNPLFIVELARARRTGGELPMTVQAAIAARIDELPQSDRQLIQHAAVVGETFGVRDAALLSDRDPAEAAGTLARLAHGRYLSPVDGQYRFHHALVRDVAYGRVPIAERMRLHARYAREGVDRDDAEALAHHWWEALGPTDATWVWEGAADLAGMREEALEAHLEAGKRRADRLSPERALELYDRALTFAAGPADLGRIEEGIGWAYARNAQGDESWDHRLKAIDAYRSAGVDPPAALYADMLAVPVMNFGYFMKGPTGERVGELLAEGERVARISGDEMTLMRLTAERAVFSGDAEIAAEAARMADATPDQRTLGEVFRPIAIAQFFAGRLTEAEATFRRVESVAAHGGYVNVGEILLWRALMLIAVGDLAQAETVAHELDAVAATSTAHTRGHALGVWGMILAAKGEWDAARETAGTVEQLVTANPTLPFCLIPAAATAAGASADLLAGRAAPQNVEDLVERMQPWLPTGRAGTLVILRAMSNGPAFGPDLDEAYGAKLWWDRNILDPLGFNPAIALVIAGRHADASDHIAKIERFAKTGSRVAGALAAAIREELAPSSGAKAAHAALRELGYEGYSDLLRFRSN